MAGCNTENVGRVEALEHRFCLTRVNHEENFIVSTKDTQTVMIYKMNKCFLSLKIQIENEENKRQE